MSDNSSDQLNITQQINRLLSERVSIMRNQETLLNNQVTLATALCSALECESLDKLEERLKTVKDALRGVSDTSRDFTRNIENGTQNASNKTKTLSEAVKELKDEFVKMHPIMAGIGAGLATGFVRGVGSAYESVKNLTKGLFDIIGTLGSLAMSILSIPFKILEGLFDLAQSGGGGPSPIKVELENIRKEFGTLATNEGAAVALSLKDIRREFTNVAGSGLSVRKIFGPGLEGMAKMLAENTELAKNLGAAFSSMRDLITDHGNALMIYRKGMGLTSEQQAIILKNARFMGKSPMDTMRQFASISIRMGAQFGVNAKVISKSMAELATDVAHFGSLGPKAFGSIATYAHKLGIEIKDLAGVMDTFDDFEGGAVAAAKLAQSINMNIDSLQMLEEEDAAARIETLRQKFRESGNVYEKLNRQTKKYLSEVAGIPPAAAAAAFSQVNLTKSYKEMQKASEGAEKKTMTQEEAMKRLASSIERVFGSGGGGKFKSFFDAFTSGFASGIMRTRQFRGMLRALRRSIREVFWAGRRVGKMFVDLFPGVSKFFTGLKDVFSPRRFRSLMKGVQDAFRDLFKSLKTDPKAGVERFLKNFRELFKNFFMRSGPGAKAVIEGGKEFLKALYSVFQAVFPMVLDALAKAAEMITKFLSSPPDLESPLRKSFDGLVNALIPLFEQIGAKLGPPFLRLFEVMWKVAKPYVMKWVNLMLVVALVKIFANMLGGAFMGALSGAMAKIGSIAMTKLLEKLGYIKIPDPPPPPTGTGTPPTGTPPVPPGGGAAASLGIGKILLLVGSLIVLTLAVVLIYKRAKLKPEDAVAIGVLVASLGAAGLMMSLSLSKLPDNIDKAFAIKAATLVGIIAALAAIGVGVLYFINKINVTDIAAMTAKVVAFVTVIGTLVFATIPVIIAAAIVGKLPATLALAGMATMGLFMGVMGFVGVKIIESIAGIEIKNPAGIAAIMQGLAALLLATMPLIGAAIFVGTFATSKIGWVVLGVITIGLYVLAELVESLVNSLIPAVKTLAKVNIPDVEKFKAAVEAVKIIADSTGKLLVGVSWMAKSIAQGKDLSPEGFRENAEKMGQVINALIETGIGSLVEKLMEFSKYAKVKEGTGEAISAIGSVLGAAAQLIQAFGPGTAAEQAIATLSDSWSATDKTRTNLQTHVEDTMVLARNTMVKVIPVIAKAVKDIILSLSGLDIPESAKNIGPILSGIAPLFTAAAALVNALSPSDGAWRALSETLTGTMTSESAQQAMFDLVVVDMKRRLNNMVPIMENMRTMIITVISGIKGPITEIATSLSGMNTENLKTIIPLVSTVLEFSSNLISNIGPVLEAANKASETSKFGEQTNNFRAAIGTIMWAMKELGPVFQTLVEPMKSMVKSIIDIATGLPNTRGLKGKVEVVTAAVQAVGALSSIFGKGGDFGSVGESGYVVTESIVSGMASTMKLVTDILLRADGPLFEMAKALSALDLGNTRNLKKNAAAVKSIGEGVGDIAAAFAPGSGIAQFGSTTFGAGSGGFIEALQGKIKLFTSGGQAEGIFRGMKNVIDQVPESVPNRAEAISNMVATLASISTSLQSTSLTGEDLSAFVQLNNALRGNSKLTVEHKNLNITMNVNVQMSAEQIANGIIKVNDINTGVPGKQKFVTKTE